MRHDIPILKYSNKHFIYRLWLRCCYAGDV